MRLIFLVFLGMLGTLAPNDARAGDPWLLGKGIIVESTNPREDQATDDKGQPSARTSAGRGSDTQTTVAPPEAWVMAWLSWVFSWIYA